jgi:hypothetical protein
MVRNTYKEIYYLGNPAEFSIRALAEELIGLIGSSSRIVYMPLPADDRGNGGRTSARRTSCSTGDRRCSCVTVFARRSLISNDSCKSRRRALERVASTNAERQAVSERALPGIVLGVEVND